MMSERLARELWGQPSAAIGKRVRPYPAGVWREVVGVVSDMRDDGLHAGNGSDVLAAADDRLLADAGARRP